MTRTSSRVTPTGVPLPRDRALAVDLLRDFAFSSGRIDGSGDVRDGQGTAMIKELQVAYFASPNGLAFGALGLTAAPSFGEARGDGTVEGTEDLGKSSILRRIGGPLAPERDL